MSSVSYVVSHRGRHEDILWGCFLVNHPGGPYQYVGDTVVMGDTPVVEDFLLTQ